MASNTPILITGGSGLLALNLALTMRDKNLVTLGIHERIISLERVNTCQCSLESLDSIQQIIDEVEPEHVIHTAGLTSVDECEAEPELAYHANVELAENIAKSCSSNSIRLVHISTDHLFSGDSAMVEEDQPVNPVNIYGKTKAEAELRVLDSNPEALVVRTNFYGWGPDYRRSFSDVIIDSLRNKQTLTLFEDVFYTPILISSLTSAVMKLTSQSAKGIFHVVGDERISKYEFGLKVAHQFGLDSGLIKVGRLADKPGLVKRPLDMSLSNKKVCSAIEETLGGVDDDLQTLCKQEVDNSYEKISNQ